jgi:Zn-dependent peptidase ImmA (M78 family)/transcriptional regulator with XRE-family HTH domain
MRSEPIAGVQPEIMRWARDSVGLSIADVAHKLKRHPEEIEAWEAGTAAPTYPQLEKLAYELYKRPLAMFFLPTVPDEKLPKHEFRTLPATDLASLHKDTYLHIRRAHAHQLALKELFGDSNPYPRCIWLTLSLSLSQSITAQARAIREALGITMEQQLAWHNDEVALKAWRQAIESAGIFVFKAAFKQKDISGFCLMDANFPVIYLNNSTTKTRQTFSLLHELAHLLLNMNGLSKFDSRYIEQLPQTEKQIERFCNAIAAEVLMPSLDFSQQMAAIYEGSKVIFSTIKEAQEF